MLNTNLVNGIRTDNINNLNYLRLIKDNLYIGFLNRSKTAWGTAILIGIDTSAISAIPEFTALINKDLSGLDIYVKLFNEGGIDTNGNIVTTCHIWKVLRINEKWILIENETTSTIGSHPANTYTEYVKEYLSQTYMIDLYSESGGTFTKINFTAPDHLRINIRYKNPDLDFYNSNKSVYLSSSGMTTAFEGFEDLLLLENSKDNTSIKILNVPDSIFAKIENGTINLSGRRFDAIDSNSNTTYLKGILFDTIVNFNDVKILKFSYPTQKGTKVILATNNIYENTYEIYPDYAIDLITEMINDNLPPGLDMTYVLDNYVYDSLFIPQSTDETFDYTHLQHWDFIETCQPTVYFASLANESNRTISAVNGEYLDDSVYVVKAASGISDDDWEIVKKNNLNKLLLNYELPITRDTTAPGTPANFDLWYDTTNNLLKMYGSIVYINDDNTSSIVALTGTITFVGQDLTGYLAETDSFTLAACVNAENNNTFVVDTIEFTGGNTVITVVDSTGMVDETFDDGGNPLAVTLTIKWIRITNSDLRQIAVFYKGSDDYIDLLYLTNINKINPTGTMNFQLIL